MPMTHPRGKRINQVARSSAVVATYDEREMVQQLLPEILGIDPAYTSWFSTMLPLTASLCSSSLKVATAYIDGLDGDWPADTIF